jgi:alanyl-tRNA synthetase
MTKHREAPSIIPISMGTPTTSNELREAFIGFFAEFGHEIRPSASLIPTDPTLMLNNAGMVPFKPYFLGEEKAPWDRAVTSQKCVRTIDIDIIGTTDRHLSFFEMLGNFSFGDYFKLDAARFAHRFLTKTLGLDPERLWYTVHESDDEAEDIWLSDIGIPKARVQRGGRVNFWQMGVAGPCGPSSEIFYDRGPQYGVDGGPLGPDGEPIEAGEDRFVEIWNLVFMQNIQDIPYHVVGDLPNKSIDTGMGLERLAMVVQGVENVFMTDLLKPAIEKAASLTDTVYGIDEKVDVALRILGDHARTAASLISDGVVPSNEGRGYVLRRLIRRAVRHAWSLGSQEQVMAEMADAAVTILEGGYPELRDNLDFIKTMLDREERQFRRTLASGQNALEAALDEVDSVIPGSVAFRLHDTFGFPIEVTKEIADERGYSVDEAGFQSAMTEQKERARSHWKGAETASKEEAYRRILDVIGGTEFLGYDQDQSTSRVLAVVQDGEQIDRAQEGQDIEIFLDSTVFYAESGGQVGDIGRVETPTGVVVINDTQHAVQGLFGHRGTVTSGFIQVGQDAEISIDSMRRDRIRKSHTGTHILHWALREVLGKHVKQAGSLVEDGRLRFDFSHFEGMTGEEFRAVELLTNERIIANQQVGTEVMGQDEARDRGAVAFFGDKYGDRVRVVSIGGYSVEFCGGTHTTGTGAVGPAIVLSEASIGSNQRRLEVLVGDAAYTHLVNIRSDLSEASRLLNVVPSEVPERIASMMGRAKVLEAELSAVRDAQRGADAKELATQATVVGDHSFVVAHRDNLRPDEMRRLALEIRSHFSSGVVVVGGATAGKGAVVVAVSPHLTGKVNAGEVAGAAARAVGGGGGRDPELAQAGGPNGAAIEEALEIAREAVAHALT